MPAIWWASQGGYLQEVRNLLAQGVDINERGGNNQTSPLYEAAYAHREEVVKLLLTHGADASAKDNRQLTTMHYLIMFNRMEMLFIFLEHGVEVSPRDRHGFTPLHCAVESRDNSMAQVLLLLENGADVNAKATSGITPLHEAARRGFREVVRLLVHKKADLQSQTITGATAEDVATANGHVEIAGILRAEAERQAERLRVRQVAFAMGLHDRLGAGSIVLRLDPGVLRIVLQRR
jgi:ankyrin repeat protein